MYKAIPHDHEGGLHTILIVCHTKQATIVHVTAAYHVPQQVCSSAFKGAPRKAEAQQLPPVRILEAYPCTLAQEPLPC